MKYDATTIAGRYDSGRRMPETAMSRWLEAIARHIDASEIRTILDVGCGTARFSARLNDAFQMAP